jgi:hypothetical protein
MPLRVGVLPNMNCQHIKPRKPKNNNHLLLSSFRSHALAHEHLHCWFKPHSDSFHNSILDKLPLADVLQLFDVMLISVETKTCVNYGAGLLHFHQYCDTCNIAEDHRMPALDRLLATFIASWAGKVATTTTQNWLASLHFWHTLHGAPWYGSSLLRTSTARLMKLVPDSSKRPCRPLVTVDHMHALFKGLSLSNVFNSSVFTVVCHFLELLQVCTVI